MIDFEKFDSLDAEKQAEVFRSSTIKEKGELLIRSHEPSSLVRALSQEELYLIAKEIDTSERSEILKYADLDQLFFFSDIECWMKDRISPKGFVTWLETLKLADDAKLLQWLVYGDYELVVAGLKLTIEVIKAEREYATDELLGDTPFFTLDENYFISVRDENLELMRKVFELLFENHRGRYIGILEGILAEVDDQIEEEAYIGRERRLSERGFPSQEFARSIYRPMTQEEFLQFPLKTPNETTDSILETSETRKSAPNYIALWSKDRLFLDDALTLLSKEGEIVFNQVREELAWLANKVIACEGIDFSSEEKVTQGIERARRMVNLGLEKLCAKDVVKAAQLMKERWMETIFRIAATELFQLRERALSIVRQFWNSEKDIALRFLDEPYDYILRGLLKTVPEFYEPKPKSELLYRDFATRDDILRASRAIDQLQCANAVLERNLPGVLEFVQKSIKDQADITPTLFRILIQSFAWFILNQKFSYKPVSLKNIEKFFSLGWTIQGKKVTVRHDMKESFLQTFFTVEERGLLTPVWSLAFDRMQEEFSDLDLSSKKKLQLKFFNCLMVGGS